MPKGGGPLFYLSLDVVLGLAGATGASYKSRAGDKFFSKRAHLLARVMGCAADLFWAARCDDAVLRDTRPSLCALLQRATHPADLGHRPAHLRLRHWADSGGNYPPSSCRGPLRMTVQCN